jgi:hypothetical protein
MSTAKEIIDRLYLIPINQLYIENTVNKISTKLNNNDEQFVDFWFKNTEYNILNYNIQLLLHYILSIVDLKALLVKQFLDNIGDKFLLNRIGISKVTTGDKYHYRLIRLASIKNLT